MEVIIARISFIYNHAKITTQIFEYEIPFSTLKLIKLINESLMSFKP